MCVSHVNTECGNNHGFPISTQWSKNTLYEIINVYISTKKEDKIHLKLLKLNNVNKYAR